MKFKRNIDSNKAMEDAFVNSFYKTGFINDDIFDRDSRDIWKAFIRLLSNSNSSSVFSSILVAYKKLPYSSELVQTNMTETNTRKNRTRGYDDVSNEVFVDVKLDYYEFYECIFANSPYMYPINVKSKECISNTIRLIKKHFSEDNGYTVVESSILALYDSLNMAFDSDPDTVDMREDLLIRERKGDGRSGDVIRVRMIAPMLIDDSYYVIDGIRTYPVITEAYNYTTSQYGQKEFIYKVNVSGKNGKSSKGASHYEIKLGYFDTAFLETGSGPEIFYLKTMSNKFYNPLMFLNKVEANDLVNEILADKLIKPENKRILKNTYKHYLNNIDEIRRENMNLIPNIKVWRDNDSFFDEKIKESYNDDNFKIMRYNRRMISKNLIKSLIYGFNGVRFYSFYGHMADSYLMSTHKDSKASKITRSGTIQIKADMIPKNRQIYATIRSNKELCANYDNKNPYDVWARVSYRKFVTPNKTDLDNMNNNKQQKKQGPHGHLRYLTEEEYTMIDSTTTKSENTSGLVSSFTLFNHCKEAFRKAEDV